jgi:hypothetical protein
VILKYATAAMLNRACSASLKNLSHKIVLFHISSLIKGEINQVKLIFGDALNNIDVVMNGNLKGTIVPC